MATTLADAIALWTSGWTAGETKTQVVAFDSSYSAADHDLRYDFRGEEDVFTVNGADTETTKFRVLIPASTTLGIRPGEYVYVGFATDTNGVATVVDEGAVSIKPNPTRVSHAQRCLQAIRARIEGRASSDQLTLQLGDVTLAYMTPSQLLEWESVFAAKVRAELSAAVGAVSTSGRGRLLTEFVR